MKKHHVDILISEADVRSRITELGAEITHFYQQKAIDKLIVVGLLRGSFMFMADLVRELKLPVEVEFMTTSSYGCGMTSNHDVKITKDLEGDIRNEHVLIVEDIIDTGQTLKNLCNLFKERNAASVKIATLLDKPEGRIVEIDADYTCFTIPNEFVVGYGLDYNENYRNIPYIGILKEEVYTK